MYVSILFRMILSELTKVFLVSLLGITGILLMAGLIAEATQQGLGPTQILAAIPLLVPSMLPYTIPATTLFAACVVYGRLAADNEILAIKSAGVNLLRVVRPGLVLGPQMEEYFRRAMLLSRGDPMVFLQRPISLGLLITTALLLILMALPSIKKAREEAFQEEES